MRAKLIIIAGLAALLILVCLIFAGASDSVAFIVGTTLMYSTPLLFAALGGVISENAGIVNIGLEGIMTLGAFVGAAVGFFAGSAWWGFLAAGVVGGLFTLLHGVACIGFKANQVVSGTALNFLGPGIAIFLSRLLFDGATQTVPLDLNTKIPRPINGLFTQNNFFDLVFNQYATVYISFILVAVCWFVLYRTPFGMRIRAVGEHPRAADTLGIHVNRVRYISVAISGVLASLGGASLSVAIVSQFQPTTVSGQGFIALAALIFGKWKPQGAMFACIFFGAAQGLGVWLGRSDVQSVLPIPSQFLAMLPFVLTIVVLMSFVGKAIAPSADGIPYEKDATKE